MSISPTAIFLLYKENYDNMLPLTERFVTMYKKENVSKSDLDVIYKEASAEYEAFENSLISESSLVEEFKRYSVVNLVVEVEKDQYLLHVIRNRF